MSGLRKPRHLGPPGPQGDTGETGAAGTGLASGTSVLAEEDVVEGEQGFPGPQGATGTAGVQGPQGPIGVSGDDGLEGESGMPLPGPTGATGAAGAAGVQGAPGVDGEDGEASLPIPGPQGAQGVAGAQGAQGIHGVDGLDGEPEFPIPGPAGAVGATGATGPAGAAGQPGDSIDESPLMLFEGIPSGLISRSQLAPDARGWTFLGTIAGTGVTVGPLVWLGLFQQIYFEYIIGGYNGGTPVGRLLCGAGAPSTVGLTNGSALLEGVTLNVTSVSKPGVPLAVTLSAIARSGRGFIKGASGALKQIIIDGMSGNPAVATAPTVFTARSFFSDLGTNLPIQQLQLSVYDTLIATALSVQAFIAPTQLWAWGRNND